MGAVDQIVTVDISLQTSAVQQAGFGIPLILGTSGRFLNGDLWRAYTSTAAMLTDGFLTSDPEYILALALEDQNPQVTEFLVGKATAAVAQVDTLAVGTLNISGHVYTFTLNGTAINYTSVGTDTQQSILTSLLAAINTAFPTNPPVTGVVTGTGPSALLTLTSSTPGLGVSYSAIDPDLTQANTVANHSQTADLQAIQAQTSLFYCVLLCSIAKSDILQMAGYIESQQLIMGCESKDSDIPTSVTTDVMSQLKAANYTRTFLFYRPNAPTGVAAAVAGSQLPLTPGASTWKFKTCVGQVADALSSTIESILLGVPGAPGKNANVYESIAGVSMVREGWMASGQFIDVTIGVDWTKSNLQTAIMRRLTQTEKVPYTDDGTNLLITDVEGVLKQGAVNGLIDKNSISVSAPLVASVSANQRAQRVAPTITWSCRLAGAFHFVIMQGTLTV